MRRGPLYWLGHLSPPLLTRLLGGTRQQLRAQVARARIGGTRRLHLACGGNLMDGWANIDLEGPARVIKLDLTAPLPVGSDTMDRIYSEHFIEHIERSAAERLLAECHRALRPGGVLRISTPDLRFITEQYRSGRLDEWHDVNWHPDSPCRLLNDSMRLWGHHFLYDEAELRAVFARAGFSEVATRGWRQSPHADLAGLECRPWHHELIVEAVK